MRDGVLAFGVVFCVIAVVFFFLMWQTGSLNSHGPGLSYADFVSILLTAVAVLVTTLAVFVAVIAVWGYRQIKTAAEKRAEVTAAKVAARAAEPVATRAAEAYLAARYGDVSGDRTETGSTTSSA